MSLQLRPLLSEGDTLERWENELRGQVLQRWQTLLGRPSFDPNGYDKTAILVAELEGDECRAQWWSQPIAPGHYQKVILLIPNDCGDSVPGAVVPFYHPETVSGLELNPQGVKMAWDQDNSFRPNILRVGLHLVRQGFIVVCVEAFPYNTVPDPQADRFVWWRLGAEKLLADNPHWTGLGRLVHDTSRGIDLLLEQKQVDPKRILATGHSLGGKRSFYTAALDSRVTCTICSDFGLPWRSTNWHDIWYLGNRVPADDLGMAHHELLALMAPHPFYLIAGEADTEESWRYMDAARPVYALYGKENEMDGINHATGHTPTIESMDLAYAWLQQKFQLPKRNWHPPAGF